MKSCLEIESFIRELFERSNLNYGELITFHDEEADVLRERPLSIDGEMDPEAVREAAKVLGLPVSALMEMDRPVAERWLRKYRYFSLLEESRRRHGEVLDGSDLVFLSKRGEDASSKVENCGFDHRDVYRRMRTALLDEDRRKPGTWRGDARIDTLQISTRHFLRQPEIVKLTEAYLELVERMGALFSEARSGELAQEEIQEYNFLANVLGIEDHFYRGVTLTYERLKLFISDYRMCPNAKLFDFVLIDPNRLLQPWRCAEFASRRELVVRFLRACPQAVAEIREFAESASCYLCEIRWSDEPTFRHLSTNRPEALPIQTIRIPKSADEMDGDRRLAEILKSVLVTLDEVVCEGKKNVCVQVQTDRRVDAVHRSESEPEVLASVRAGRMLGQMLSERHISLKHFAGMSNCSERSIRRYIHSGIANIDDIERFAKLLKIPLREFLQEAE